MEKKRNITVFPPALKKQLSFFLAVVMLVTMVAVGIVPMPMLDADAAVNAKSDIKTTYSWTISVATTDSADCNDNSGATVRLYGITNNGQGSETEIQSWGYTSYAQGGGTLTASGTSTSFPYKIYVFVDLDAGAPYRVWEGTLTLTVNGTQMFSSSLKFDSGQNGLWSHQQRDGERHTDTRPSLAGVYIDGGSTSVNTSGSTTSTYTIKGYDNYDVQWSASLSNPSISSSNGNATVSGSGTSRTVTFGNNNQNGANTGVDYSTVIYGSAGGLSTGTSGWKTVSVSVKTTHKLTVNVAGGNGGNYTRTGYTGGTTSISNPTRTGYEFSSWTVNGGSMSGTTYTFANRGESTITANWTPHTYTVAYNANGGSGAPGNQTKTYGTNLTLSSTQPTRTGYTFDGWDIYVGNTSQNAHIGAGGTLSTDYVSAQGDTVTLKAKWNAKTWNVIFNGNGKTSGTMTNQSFTSGTPQNLKANTYGRSHTVTWNYNGGTGSPASSTVNYTFDGWSESAGSTSSSGTTTTIGGTKKYDNQASLNLARDADYTLYARWKTTSNSVTAPTPTKNGYDFDKWYTNSDFTGTSYAAGTSVGPVTSNLGLYAKWTQHAYTITYKDSLDSTYSSTQTYYIENAAGATVKAALTKTGYDWAGWKCTSATAPHNWTTNQIYNAGTSLTNKYGDVTLTAQWNPHTYTIAFNGNKPSDASHDVASVPGSQTKTYGTNLTLTSSVPTLEGWTFTGWNTAADGSGTTYSAGGTLDRDYASATGATVTLYAMWSKNPYTVHFNGNGATSGSTGDSNGNQAFTYDIAQNLSPNHFARAYTVTYNYNYTNAPANTTDTANATFNGWATDADGEKVYDDQQSVKNLIASGTFQLYANWTLGKVTLPTPTRPGYDFDGWYDAATGGSKIGDGGASYTPSADKELFAHWTQQTYKFVYNANKPSIATANVNMNGLTYTQKTYAANVNLSSTEPSLTGWTFTGWNTKADGTGLTFAAGALIDNDNLFTGKNCEVQLYATWRENVYKIHFNSALKTGGSMTDQEQLKYDHEYTLTSNGFTRTYTVTYNENYTGPSNHPATATYNIKGWTAENKESQRNAAVDYANEATVRNLTAADGGTAQLYIVWKDGGVVLENYNRAGYDLEGWYTDSGCTAANRVGAPGDTYYPTAGIMLYANWVEHTYDIVYDANTADSGTVPATQENCGYLHQITLANNTGNLAKTGYTLTGWNKNASGGASTHFDLGQTGVEGLTMEDSITLYAEWTPNNYTVTFHKNDGTSDTSTGTATFDSPWPAVPAFSRTGYSIEGWYAEDGTTKYYNGNGTAVNAKYTIADNTDVYAHWVGLTYNVIYNKNTTDTVAGMPSPDTVTKRYGTAITLPAAPSRTGYAFKGWDTNENAETAAYSAGGSFNADPADITQDGELTLYAIWAPVTYTVQYDANKPAATGNTVTNVPDSQTKTYDSPLTLSSTEPGLTGYTFNGWNTAADGNGTAYTKGAEMATDHANTQNAVVTLYAQWAPITYEVAFAGGGATGTTAQPNGGTMPNQSFSYDEEKALSANTYERKYTVTYNYNYDIPNGSDVAEYTFNEWSSSLGGTYQDAALVKNLSATDGAEITLTAQWNTDDVTLPTPTRSGYSFGGWYLNEGCTGTSYEGGSSYTPAENTTLYAKWTADRYKITYTDSLADVNENASGVEHYYITAETTDGAVSEIKTPEKTGYDFAGWTVTTTAGNWNEASYAGGTSVEGKYGAVTLEAQWTAHIYTVAYNANLPKDSKGETTSGTAGNMPAPLSVTKTYGTDLELSNAVPALTGYTFVGWNTNPAATTAEYAPGAAFNDAHFPGKNETVTLYAVWAPYTYTVNYNGNGNTGGNTAAQNATYDVYFNLTENGFVRSHTVTYKYLDGRADTTDTAAAEFANWSFGGNTYTDGQEVVNLTSAKNGSVTLTANWTFGSVTLPTPTRTGYTFKGWYTDEACETKAADGGASYTLDKNTTLYAKWEAVTYTVEYYAGTDATGDRPDNQSVVYDTLGVNAYATQGSFVKPGYSFTGWNTAENGSGTPVAGGYAFTNNNLRDWADSDDVIKLYAQWTPNTYVIVYDKGAGTSGSTGSQTIRYDLLNTFTVAENGFSYPGYTFTEWKAANNQTYAENAPVTSALLLDNGVQNTADGYYYLTLTAQWERNHSTLKIDRANNDAIITVTQDSQTTYNVSGDFTKTGYTFRAWTLTGEEGAAPNGSVDDLTSRAPVYTFGNENRKTDTLTAQWDKNPYTLIYHYNVDGAPASEKSVTVYYDTEFTFPPKDYFGYRLGYEIDGWATEPTGEIVYDCSQVSPETENLATGEPGSTEVHLYAIWTAKQYKVRFYVNTGFHFTEDAAAEYIEKDIVYGGSQTFTVQLEEGYTQSTGRDPAAYVESGTGAVPDGVKDTSNNTITFTVTNHGESDLVVKTNPLDLNTYTVILMPLSDAWDPAEMGYRRPTVQTKVTHGDDLSFGVELLDGYNVAEGGDLIASATVGGTSVTPAVSGSYTFTVANVTGSVEITMTNALKNTSAVKFDANGGKWTDNTTLKTDTNSYGETYEVAEPGRTGYTFAGWAKVTEGENASTAAGSLSGNTYTYGTAQGTDYYAAQWTPETYTVVFDGNNGLPNTQTKTATYNEQWPAPDTVPERTGYDFGGWCEDAEGITPVDLTQPYTNTSGVTVYAKWTKHQYSISLEGTPVGYTVAYPQNAYYGDDYTFTITPENGYDVNAVNVSVTGNGGYTTSVADGVMTVSVSDVNDNNVITVSGAMLQYTVSTNLVNPEAFAAQPAMVTVNYNTEGVTVEVQMADGWQNAAPAVEVVSEQAGLTASASKKEGTNDTYVISLTGAITANVTLNVTGAPNTYTVTLNGSEVGYTLPDPNSSSVAFLGNTEFIITLKPGYTQTQPADISVVEVNGHAVLTKEDDTHIKVRITSEQPGNVTVTLGDAKQETYTLTFINNGGDTLTVNEPVPAASSSIGYFDTFTFSITLAEGYTAATPALTSDNANVTVTAVKDGSTVTYTVKNYFTANTVLTLQKADANTSTVTVALNGGTLAGVEDGASYNGAYNSTKSFGKPVKTGYTFAGWVLNSGANGALSGSTYTFGPTDGAEDTITATWTANTYTVTFDANGGVPTTRTADATYNEAYPTVDDPTRTGYDFVGWFTAAENGDEITLGSTVYDLTSATTLYAHWDIHESTLTVDPDGGKVAVDSTEYNNTVYTATKAYLETAVIGEPTKTGYDFAGWTRTGENGTFANGTYTFGPAADVTDTLTATWTPKTYTVTYYKNDGTDDYTTRTVAFNAAWPEAPTVSWAGHTFDGWFTAPDDTGSPATFEGNYTAAENTAVYAHWHINHSYVLFTFDGATMTVDGNAYSGSFSANGDSGDTVTIAVPVKTGHTFTGWSRTTAANGTLDGVTYTFGNAAGTQDAPETFVAQFKANTYTVTFDANNGVPATQTAEATYSQAYPAPATAEPTRTGYDFSGWFTAASGGSKITLGETIYELTASTTLYAHWNVHTGTVTVKANGGNWNGNTEDKSFTGEYGGTQSIPEPARTGYTFNGWALTGKDGAAVNGSVSGNTYTFGPAKDAEDILTAQWVANTSTVTVDLAGGTGDTEGNYTQAYSTTLTLTEPTRTGYTFDGWTLSSGANGSLTGNTYTFGAAAGTTDTVTAKWRINTSTVTVDLAGGTGATTGEYTQEYNTALTLAEPTKTGYTFTGWALTSEGTVNGSVSGNIYTFGPADGANDILTAKWEINRSTVIVKANGGNWDGSTEDETYTKNYGATQELPEPTRTGYTFDGWTLSSGANGSLTGSTYTFGAAAGTTDTVTAKWKINTSKVTVDLAGGTGDTEGEYTQAYNSTLTLTEPTKNGYTFTGWVLGGDENGTLVDNTYTFGAEKDAEDTITAQWEANTYTVVYDGNSGTPTTQRKTATYNAVYPAATAPTRTGYTFAGWFTAAEGGSEIVPGTDVYTLTEGTTLYAHWTVHTSKVTVVLAGGTGDTEGEYTQAYNTALTLSAPTKTGYSFIGWQLNEGANGSVSGSTYTFGAADGAADTLTAQWRPNTYTVVYDANGGAPTTQTKTATYNVAYPAAAEPTRTGYTFAGWFTEAEDGDEIEPGTTVYKLTEGVTLYAHWSVHTSTVTVDLAGGTGETEGDYTQAYGTELPLAEPTRTGYAFTGWSLNANANGSLAGSTYTFGAADGTTDTVTANWQINTYDITLNTGAGYTVPTAPAATVNHGGTWSVTIVLEPGYANSEIPAATVTGGANDYTASRSGNEITYTVTDITGATTITIADAERSTFNVSVTANGSVGIDSFTPTDSVEVVYGTGTAEITVTLNESYSESDAPSVDLVSGAAEISGGVKSTENGKTVYTYTVTNVTEDSVFHIGSADPNSYFVALNATSVGYTVNTLPASTVLYNGSTQVVVTLNEGYTESDIPAYSVKIGNTLYEGENNGHITASREGSVITYTVTGITANTQINIGSAQINTYGITLNASEVGYTVTTQPAADVNHGGSVTFTVTLAEGYSDSSVPAISATNAASAVGYKDGNTVTYIVTGITDDTVITVGNAVQNTYTVIFYPGVGVTIRDSATGTAYSHGQRIENVPYGTVIRFVIDDTGAATPVIYANSVEVPAVDGVYSVTVTSNVNITTEDLMYTATFINYDNRIIASYVVPCGGTAVYSGATPVKPGTDYHDYVFNGWLCVTPEGEWAIGENMDNLLENRVFQAQYVTYHKNLPITSDGTNHWWYCPDCGYTEGTEAHTEGAVEFENVLEARCTVRGHHDEVTYCAICRRELSRVTVDDGFDYTKHPDPIRTYTRVLYQPTCVDPGMRAVYCLDCDHVVAYEDIPANGTSHSWGAWIDNGNGTHTRTCVYCGETAENGAQTEPHTLREIYRSAPTCVSEGCIVSYCPSCATVVTKTLPATGKHTPGDVYWENYTAATCNADGGYDAVTYCTVCGEELSRNAVTLPQNEAHDYQLTSVSPENATCTYTGDITLTYTCTVCGKTKTETVSAPGTHTVESWTVTSVPTQTNTVGSRTGVCSVCGETVTEELYFQPVGQRFVTFVEQGGVRYSVVPFEQNADNSWSYNPAHETVVRGNVTTYTNVDLRFFVTITGQFPYSDYDVYVNGAKAKQNPDGTYTLPAGDSTSNIKVIGTTPAAVNPGDSGTDQGQNNNNVKISFWQRIINFFKSIGDFFRNMFNR